VLESLCTHIQDEKKQTHDKLADADVTLDHADVLAWVSRRYDMQSEDFPFLTEDEEAGASEIKIALARQNTH
jgi:hypothetical protein